MRTRVEDYTVGWICAISTEYVVACSLLDQEFDEIPEYDATHDNNSYTFGRIHQHNVVVACLPKGRYGNTSSALVGERMARTFPNIRFGLMVGIAGGAPSQKRDIRLGDIVVSSPTPRHGGVLQYDYGKAVQEREFEETGHLAPPPERLLAALSKIDNIHQRKGHKIAETVNNMLASNEGLREKYARPDIKWDRLYKATYIHSNEAICDCEVTPKTTDDVKNSVCEERKQRNESKLQCA